MREYKCEDCKYLHIQLDDPPCNTCGDNSFNKGHWEPKEDES